MSGRPDSYIPLYIGDYLSDAGHLETVEHGAYLLLLFHYWVKGPAAKGGGLPDNDRALASICKMSPQQWGRISATIRAFFAPAIINGRAVLVQKRIEEVLDSVTGKYEKKMAAIDAANAAKAAAKLRLEMAAGAPPDADALEAAYADASAPCISGSFSTVKPEPNLLKKKEPSSLRSDVSAGADPPAASKPGSTNQPSPNADIRECVEIYNSAAAPLGWPRCVKMTQARAAQIRQRLREFGGVEGWRNAIHRASQSPFLRGETGRSKGHENWRPDIEFLSKLENFVKLIEGSWDGQAAPQGPRSPELIAATRMVCLRDWAAGKPWIANISGNGVWRDEYGVGPPPDDPKTLVTAEDLAAVPAARERMGGALEVKLV